MKDQEFPDALPLGTVVGGYRLTRVIGQGGFGITYEAASAAGRVARRVAIKEFFCADFARRPGTEIVLRSGVDRDDYAALLEKFEAEARKLVDDFDHSNIVRGENLILDHGSAFVVMEFVDGPTLKDWLDERAGPPDEDELFRVFDPILEAVAYLHDRGEMHRDLNPKNILLRQRGRSGREILEPVLIDFGAMGDGLDTDRNTTSIQLATRAFGAPEQLLPALRRQGRYTDIFGLGGVLYRAITGRNPAPPLLRWAAVYGAEPGPDPYIVAADAIAARTIKHKSAPPRASLAFLEGIDEALRLDPRNRPQTIEAFRRTLGWDEATPISVPAPRVHPPSATTDGGTVLVLSEQPRRPPWMAEQQPPPEPRPVERDGEAASPAPVAQPDAPVPTPILIARRPPAWMPALAAVFIVATSVGLLSTGRIEERSIAASIASIFIGAIASMLAGFALPGRRNAEVVLSAVLAAAFGVAGASLAAVGTTATPIVGLVAALPLAPVIVHAASQPWRRLWLDLLTIATCYVFVLVYATSGPRHVDSVLVWAFGATAIVAAAAWGLRDGWWRMAAAYAAVAGPLIAASDLFRFRLFDIDAALPVLLVTTLACLIWQPRAWLGLAVTCTLVVSAYVVTDDIMGFIVPSNATDAASQRKAGVLAIWLAIAVALGLALLTAWLRRRRGQALAPPLSAQ